MRRPIFCALVLMVAAAVGARTAQAEDAAALKERLNAAEQASTLSGDGVLPYYIKMTVQLFDKKGKPDEQGTIEIYWAGKDREKRIYAFPSYSATEVRTDGKLFRTPNAENLPVLVRTLIGQVQHPMSTRAEIDGSQPQMQTINFGKVPLECIMLGQAIHGLKSAPMGLFPTYCFDPGKDALRIRFDYGTQFVTRNAIATFQQRTMATKMSVTESNVVVATAELVSVNQRAISDADLATDGLQEVGANAPTKVGSGVIQGMAVSQPQPFYPMSAKQNHVTGLVVMRAIIGTDGHIENLNVVSSPDPDLAIAALAAVRQWTYRPYLLAGAPVEVETTINVNFTMGP